MCIINTIKKTIIIQELLVHAEYKIQGCEDDTEVQDTEQS